MTENEINAVYFALLFGAIFVGLPIVAIGIVISANLKVWARKVVCKRKGHELANYHYAPWAEAKPKYANAWVWCSRCGPWAEQGRAVGVAADFWDYPVEPHFPGCECRECNPGCPDF